MTTQVNLDLIWALTGGVTDPGDVKYNTGWVSEIPTFQNFNFVLQNHSKNLLALAEAGEFDWQTEIAYTAGTKVIRAGKIFTCRADNTAEDPSLDTPGDFWIAGTIFGDVAPTDARKDLGVQIKNVNPRNSATTWDGSDETIHNASALIELVTTNVASKNWLLGNVSGELVVIDLDTDIIPDGRSIAVAEPTTHRLFHEGHPPVVAEVAGAVEDVANDGIIYARKDGAWVVVAGNIVADEPPPPSIGSGTGWYNLADGKYYIDINDGDSSQWVPANPPLIPDMVAELIGYTGELGANVQEALDVLEGANSNVSLDNGGVYTLGRSSGSTFSETREFPVARWGGNKSAGSVSNTSYSVITGVLGNSYNNLIAITTSGYASGQVTLSQITRISTATTEKTLTFSFTAKSSANDNMDIKVHTYPIFVRTELATKAIVLKNTDDFDDASNRYSITFTIPANAIYYELGIEWAENAGFTVGRFQLDEGSIAFPYKEKSFTTEVTAAESYYQKHWNSGDNLAYAGQVTNVSSARGIEFSFPTMVEIPSYLAVRDATGTTVSSVQDEGITENYVSMRFTASNVALHYSWESLTLYAEYYI